MVTSAGLHLRKRKALLFYYQCAFPQEVKDFHGRPKYILHVMIAVPLYILYFKEQLSATLHHSYSSFHYKTTAANHVPALKKV